MDESASTTHGPWTFLTNHAHILICLHADPTVRVRDLADLVGITERAAHRILGDLIRAGYVTRERDGRRNRYRLSLHLPMRHPLERTTPVCELVEALASSASPGRPPASVKRRPRVAGPAT
jgi:DNA-binding transcriptional ArsR family regulator